MGTTVSSRIVTIPNILSLFRLLLIPVFLVLLLFGEYAWALLILVVSAGTDFIDGYVARRFNQITRLGQLLDPAADRLFIFSTLIGLAWQGLLPWWFVLLIVTRDVLLLVLGVVLSNSRFIIWERWGPSRCSSLCRLWCSVLPSRRSPPSLIRSDGQPQFGGVSSIGGPVPCTRSRRCASSGTRGMRSSAHPILWRVRRSEWSRSA
jgi:hypothetical protein